MDKINNPFCPGAGSPPPELSGRQPVLEQAKVLLGRVKRGRSEKSMLLTGLRGVGKTVLLNEIERYALADDYRTILIEAHEGKSLVALLAPQLRSLLFDLDRMANLGNKAKRALIVLKSFVSAVKVKIGEIELGVDLEPEMGVADSGDLEIDLPSLFTAIGEAAEEKGIAVAILIDEIQYFTTQELSALIMAMHKMQQKSLPLVLVGAGLPILPGLAGNSKSYAERLFDFPNITALSEQDAIVALQEPVQERNVVFSSEALAEIYRLTQGYPYFIQEWGYQAWNYADQPQINLSTIHKASEAVSKRLDQNFFRVRFDRLTPKEKEFLKAMAVQKSQPCQFGDVVKSMDSVGNMIGPVRVSLIKKGMVYSPAHGKIAFTVPLFGEYILRVIP